MIEILDIKTILNQPDPDWLIEGWLPEDAFVVLAGPSNTYKSFLAGDWGCCIASTRDWLWHPPKHGPVLYVFAEGGTGMGKRVRAWMKHYKHKEADLALFNGI